MDPVTNYCAAILGENKTAMSAIRLIPELAECSDELLALIYAYSKPVDIPPGETLIKEGMFDQWVYFVIRGELDVLIDGEYLGSTGGPIVGERCILGEPRGADLVSGKDGLMALGVEMSIIDALNREINNFQQTAASDEEAEAFANDRMALALEILIIILNEVIGRITHLYDSGVTGAKHLDEADQGQSIKTRGLYEFSEDRSPSEEKGASREFLLYSFSDFSETVYYELLQKYLSEYGFSDFPLEAWKERFSADENGNVSIGEAFDWLNRDFNIANTTLVEIASSIFEVASQYTAAANKAVNQVFSAFERERDKERARNASSRKNATSTETLVGRIRQELFEPVQKALNAGQTEVAEEGPSKMSQADIDALFG